MNFMTNNSGLGKIILIVIIATIILLTLLFSMVYEALFSVKFRKCYFDNDVNTINLNLTFFKLFMLAVSLSFIMFALYSLANTIYSTYSEISENVTTEIVRSSRLNLFGTEASNKLKQFNVNVQSELTNDNTTTPASDSYSSPGSATECVNDYTHSSSSKVNNTAQQENTNTQNGWPVNVAIQKNSNTQIITKPVIEPSINSSQTTIGGRSHSATHHNLRAAGGAPQPPHSS